jgi:hypothetical protein
MYEIATDALRLVILWDAGTNRKFMMICRGRRDLYDDGESRRVHAM